MDKVEKWKKLFKAKGWWQGNKVVGSLSFRFSDDISSDTGSYNIELYDDCIVVNDNLGKFAYFHLWEDLLQVMKY